MKGRMTAFAAVFFLMLPATGWSLTFEEVLEMDGSSYAVRSAELAIEDARGQLDLLSYAGDPSLSVQPSVSTVTQPGGPFAERIALDMSAALTVPIGLSAERKVAVSDAVRAITLAERELEIARAAAYLDLLTLYQRTWLAQREAAVLEEELLALEAAEEAGRQLYESGEISLMELNRIEDDLSALQADYDEGLLGRRIRWLELSYAAGMDPSREEILESFLPVIDPLPRPPVLTEWALERDASLLGQGEKVRQAEAELAGSKLVDWTGSVRLNAGADGHSGSISYAINSSQLGVNYSFPLYSSDGSESSGGNAGAWTAGLSVSIEAASGKEASLRESLLVNALEREKIKKAIMEESIALQIRSLHQKYLIGTAQMEQTERTLERIRGNAELAARLHAEGKATDAELMSAGSQVSRAEFQLETARVNALLNTLSTAAAASYLDEIIGGGIRE